MPIDTEKQRQLEQRVTNCIYLNVSDWMQFAIDAYGDGDRGQSCPVDVDEIPAFLPCEECKGTGYELLPDDILTDENADEWGDWSWHFPEDYTGEDLRISDDVCQQCDDGEVVVEIFEWYHVDRYLAGQLAERGEVVLEGEIWGRQCTGQAIFLDSVMEDIFDIHP